MTLRIIAFSITIYALSACQPKIDAEELSLGEIDPSVYVAIGTAGTAGYADDALSIEGQENSLAGILAQQFRMVTDLHFVQPLMPQGTVGINLSGASRLILGYKTDCNGETSLSPVRLASQGDQAALNTNIYSNGPFNNFGVQGVSILNVNLAGYGNPANGAGNFNPYFSRFAADQTSSSILQDALNRNPTFFSVQLGDDDVLSYALSGGTASVPPVANGAAGVGFDGSLSEILGLLSANGAHGVIGNIPDITKFPYFTTIPYNGLKLDAANTVTLNSVFNPLGIFFQEGDNPFTIEDQTTPYGVRKMLEGELILLSVPLDSIKCYGMGSIIPIPDKYILTLEEIQEIQTKLNAYNSIIEMESQLKNIAFVDVKSFYNSLNSGIIYNGVSMNANFVTGGFFSLDGRNLNPIGQALLANKYIESINTKYNSRIPFADVTKYPGVIFP